MDKLMTFNETKLYLKTSRATLYRWATEGSIPAGKIGNQWRFRLSRINKWLDENAKRRRKRRKKRKY